MGVGSGWQGAVALLDFQTWYFSFFLLFFSIFLVFFSVAPRPLEEA